MSGLLSTFVTTFLAFVSSPARLFFFFFFNASNTLTVNTPALFSVILLP